MTERQSLGAAGTRSPGACRLDPGQQRQLGGGRGRADRDGDADPTLCAVRDTWAAAQLLGDDIPVDRQGLTGRQATVIRLLADGHADETIAKRLGVSHRTARRIASELMERANARSLFELGVRCVHYGRLPATHP
ncbi:helix-turn-helix transcriptional regulator [Streptomyces sp. NPDC059909]|uniref:helix-turn-helix domain-containing protein n=1 Tax=Streptomyces sp. NPDC059909 TaxID=3346998 RepID=UPI0036507880